MSSLRRIKTICKKLVPFDSKELIITAYAGAIMIAEKEYDGTDFTCFRLYPLIEMCEGNNFLYRIETLDNIAWLRIF
jgi:hypothetical protein